MRGVDQDRNFAVFGRGGGVANAVVLIEMKELAGGTEDGVGVDAFGFEELKEIDGGRGVDGEVVVSAGVMTAGRTPRRDFAGALRERVKHEGAGCHQED